jgi:2,5-furandicarboxylate decarboxylase 1
MLTLSSFIEEHEADICHVRKPVSLEYVPSLTAQSSSTIVFDSIEGYEMPLVDLLFANRRVQSLTLGCEPNDVVPEMSRALRRGPKPLKLVESAPCKQRKFLGKDVDLGVLPIVRHTAEDPYPYTTCMAMHLDPLTGRQNAMFPRSGVLGPAEMVTSFVTPTANRILAQHRSKGTPMPQAIAIGNHPAWELAATYTYLHEDWWELELYESITGQVGEVVKCETVDLVVPADSAIVIEGFLHPTRTATDGPSPGPSMLFTPYSNPQPVFEVTAITMSESPIYRNHQETPFTDHQEMPRLWQEAIVYDRIRAMGIPIRDLTYPQGGAALCLVLQLDPAAEGQVADALLTAMGAFTNNKLVIAVDPDVNIYDYRDVMYALATRVDPARDVITIDHTRGWIFDPRARPEVDAGPQAASSRNPAVASRWGINATKPPAYHPAERKAYERAWPLHWGDVSLEDYLS